MLATIVADVKLLSNVGTAALGCPSSAARLSFREARGPRPCYIRSTVTSAKLQPRTALIVLTALNLLNYADRNVLFAVQPLVQDEFHLTKTQIGYLTSAFLGFYMVAAPFVGPLADRYSRKFIIVLGAFFWSG
ncbi:MAG: MFS transporter, partial [Candidatus Sulfotelmatobacter sp.]